MRVDKKLAKIADTFISIVLNNNVQNIVYEEIKQVTELLQESPIIRQYLFLEKIEKEKKKRVLMDKLSEGYSPFTVGLINYLIEKDYQIKLFDLFAYLEQRMEKIVGLYTVDIYSAYRLDEEMENRIKLAVEKVSSREMKFTSHVNPSLIGGIVLKIGDRLFDGSIKGRLEKFKKSVTEQL